MKNINQEEQSLVDFACRVCRIKNNSCRSKKGDCAYRAISHEYCPEVMQALKERNGVSEADVSELFRASLEASYGKEKAQKMYKTAWEKEI